jgi:type II secretory pathway component PulF
MKNNKLNNPHHYHVSSKEREYFTANLSLMLDAAVPVHDILSSLQESTKSRALKKALIQMQNDIDDGLPLWKALERSGIVSTQTLALAKIGEQSGNLPNNLKIAASQEAKQRILKSKISSALLYPAFVLGTTVVVGVGVAWFLLPRLAETFAQLHIKLPLISRVFINLGTFLSRYGMRVVPALIVSMIILILILFVWRPTRSLGQRLLMYIPGIAGLLREIEIARFSYMVSTLLEAGLSITKSLQLLQNATESPRYQKLYKSMHDSFDNGESFAYIFQTNKSLRKLLPSPVQQMIISGERSGNLSDTLANVSYIYEEKSDTTTRNLEAILEPILLIFVWLGVLGVAVAVILPIYSLVGGLRT